MKTRWGQLAAANAGRTAELLSYRGFPRDHLAHLVNHGTAEQRNRALAELWRRDHGGSR